MKTCTHCGQELSLDRFISDRRRKDGHGSKCRPCARSIREAFYDQYPDREAERRMKQAEASAEWYRRNRDSQAARMRENRIKRQYGLSMQDYADLFASQQGQCSICHTTDPGMGQQTLAVDHDHDTGEVRGLLCHPCNTGIGLLGDNVARLQAAAEYLGRSPCRTQ